MTPANRADTLDEPTVCLRLLFLDLNATARQAEPCARLLISMAGSIRDSPAGVSRAPNTTGMKAQCIPVITMNGMAAAMIMYAAMLACGRKINIYANIGNIGDVGYVLENDAGGIGLFRSEFLYLGRESFPTEEEQFQAYKQVAQTMGEKKVIIRTLDIGADKQADYFNLGREENPAMGYRAIRICLKEPEIFKTQLRALLRAAAYGNLSVMYPMIISQKNL